MSQDMMSFSGMDEILRNLEERLGPEKVTRVVNKVLRNEADKSVEELSHELEAAYYDTGISSEGVTHGNVTRVPGYPIIKIGNNGKHWRLIHLNENGYDRFGKSYSGAGHGVIKGYVEKQKTLFQADMAKGLKKELLE